MTPQITYGCLHRSLKIMAFINPSKVKIVYPPLNGYLDTSLALQRRE
jgi:hypothetical protein